MLRQGRAMIYISNTLNLPCMHSQSFTLITWSPTANLRQCTFCKDKTKLRLKPVLSQRQHDWGPLFETIGCFCSYAEQMASRHQCRRLSGKAAMRFPLRCYCSPFRRGEWLVGHGTFWATLSWVYPSFQPGKISTTLAKEINTQHVHGITSYLNSIQFVSCVALFIYSNIYLDLHGWH